MALTTIESGLVGNCSGNLELNNLLYNYVRFGVSGNLCRNIILG